MGDVTFLHDANGLVRDVHDPEPDLTIVVVNDDGGSIFATLEQGQGLMRTGLMRPWSSNSIRSMQVTRALASVSPSGRRW